MDVAVFPAPSVPTAAAPVTDHPGRWLGGALGVVASLLVAGGAFLVDAVAGIDLDFVVLVGMLGTPVGWILGRAALPLAREGGWMQGPLVGLAIAWAAPPLGAVVWLGFALVEANLGPSRDPSGLVEAIILLPFILPASYLAIVATIPAGLLWGILVRLVPERMLLDARMSASIARFGTRHLIAAATLALVAFLIATAR